MKFQTAHKKIPGAWCTCVWCGVFFCVCMVWSFFLRVYGVEFFFECVWCGVFFCVCVVWSFFCVCVVWSFFCVCVVWKERNRAHFLPSIVRRCVADPFKRAPQHPPLVTAGNWSLLVTFLFLRGGNNWSLLVTGNFFVFAWW
jgi:hypothetical protein